MKAKLSDLVPKQILQPKVNSHCGICKHFWARDEQQRDCPYCQLSATKAELEEAKKQIECNGRGRLTTYWVERAEAAEKELEEARIINQRLIDLLDKAEKERDELREELEQANRMADTAQLAAFNMMDAMSKHEQRADAAEKELAKLRGRIRGN